MVHSAGHNQFFYLTGLPKLNPCLYTGNQAGILPPFIVNAYT
jgi:hypothetical protein